MENCLINTKEGKKEVLGINYDTDQTAKELSQIANNSVGFVRLCFGDTVCSGSSFIYKQVIHEKNKSSLYFFTNLHVVQGLLSYYSICKNLIRNNNDITSINKGMNVNIMGREIQISELIVPKGQFLQPLGDENSHLDFAIFKVEIEMGDELKFFGTRNNWELVQGEDIFAFGYPRGMELTASDGIVGVIYDEEKNPEEFMTSASKHNKWCIQHNILINPGNSGGPTVNNRGRIVGISTRGMVSSVAVGVNFSLNMKYIMSYIKDKSNMEIIKVKEFIDFITRRAKEDSRYSDN